MYSCMYELIRVNFLIKVTVLLLLESFNFLELSSSEKCSNIKTLLAQGVRYETRHISLREAVQKVLVLVDSPLRGGGEV